MPQVRLTPAALRDLERLRANGDVDRYHYAADIVTILAIRHQKEADYER